MGEQLLWLSIDSFDRGSVAGRLDPARSNFVVAWREFHSRGSSPVMATLAIDHVEGLPSLLFTTGEPKVDHRLQVVSAGGDVFDAFPVEHRHLSILAVAAQYGAVRCAHFLLANGACAGAAEVEGAFRGGNALLRRLLCDALPRADSVV
jgi:hypothetical protein